MDIIKYFLNLQFSQYQTLFMMETLRKLSNLIIIYHAIMLTFDSQTQMRFNNITGYFFYDSLEQQEKLTANLRIYFIFSLFLSLYQNMWVNAYSMSIFGVYLCHMCNPIVQTRITFEACLSNLLMGAIVLVIAYLGIIELIDKELDSKQSQKKQEPIHKLSIKTNNISEIISQILPTKEQAKPKKSKSNIISGKGKQKKK